MRAGGQAGDDRITVKVRLQSQPSRVLGRDRAPYSKSPYSPNTDDLFRNRLSNILDQRHALLRLAGLIDWSRFEQEYGALYAE
jgi:hypothetical protein